MDTPKPQTGTWTLTAPDGRYWQGMTPLAACSAEQRERVPPAVALERIMAAASEPDFDERHVQLGKFYNVGNCDELIDAMEGHISKLQARVSELARPFSFAPQRVREG